VRVRLRTYHQGFEDRFVCRHRVCDPVGADVMRLRSRRLGVYQEFFGILVVCAAKCELRPASCASPRVPGQPTQISRRVCTAQNKAELVLSKNRGLCSEQRSIISFLSIF
jgi:hypothetical protein